MHRIILTAFIALIFHFTSTAQVDLLPQIGVEEEPSNYTPICDIPIHLGTMAGSGYHVEEMVNDFSLYSTSGERFELSQILSEGKPVLLVSGNYTCWRYRDQLDALNAIATYYADEMSTFIVNTLEAHPHNDISPYSGTVWTTDRNFTDGVLYEQPDTYGERLEIIEEMRDALAIVPEILVDDPCNQWWSHYGPAPNNVHLIDPDGTVRIKQPWLIGYPTAGLWCELSNYFDDNNPNCNEAGNNGTFSVEYDSTNENTVYGSPGDILTIPTTIQNLSDSENVVINISRQNVYIQPGWQTALCINVCYNFTVSEASVTIPPGGEQSFIFYFYTDNNEGTGTANVRFENAFSPSNFEILYFEGVTGITTGIEDSEEENWTVYPNPAMDYINLEIQEVLIGETASLYDATGRLVYEHRLSATIDRIDLSAIPRGIYYVRLGRSNDLLQKLVIR